LVQGMSVEIGPTRWSGLASTVSPYASLTPPAETEPEIADAVPLEGAAPPHDSEPPRRHLSGFATAVAMSLTCAALLGAAAPAFAQEAPPQTTVSTVTVQSDTTRAGQDVVALARRYGLRTEVLEQINARGRLADLLSSLPSNMPRLYSSLSPSDKKIILDQMHGSSGFLFIRVNHRDAFIRGEAVGHNVFDEMQKSLTEQFRNKQMNDLLYARLTSAVNSFRTMTPQERSVFMQMMEADVASLGVR